MASEVSSGTTTNHGGEKNTRLDPKLPPGFRFYPSDEELISHYLTHKLNRSFSSVDVHTASQLHKKEPWDLPSVAKMGEKEWYFFSHKDRKYPTTGMRTNRATASGYWKATGKDKEIFSGHRVLGGIKKTLVSYTGRAPIEHPTGVDVSTGDMGYVSDSTAYSAHQDFPVTSVRRSHTPPSLGSPPTMADLEKEIRTNWINEHSLITNILRDLAFDYGFNMATPKEEDSLHCSVGAPKPSVRFPTSDVLHLHSSWGRYSIHHGDLKPDNILQDEKTENQLSDFGLSRLLHANDYTQIPRGRAVPTHNRPLDAKFSGKPSAERGIEIKTGSHMTHPRTYLSVHHHPLMQMWPSARKWITSKRTFCDIFNGSISAKPKYESFGAIFKGWISDKPKYETPIAGPVSEYIIRKLFGIKNGLTVNGSLQHSDPDYSRPDHGKMAVNTKTSASWIIATAAPHHATGNRNLLSGFIMEHDDQFVHAVNRVPMKVLARGAVVTDALILPDVWFVPGLTENLVSVSQLAELDHSIGFGRGECCIRSARDAKIVGKGRLQKGGHYVLDYLKVPLAI